MQLCGLRIYNNKIIGEKTGNSKGHFEDEDFVELHSYTLLWEILKSKGWIVLKNKFMYFNNEGLLKATVMDNR
jgi:hypothetical protein